MFRGIGPTVLTLWLTSSLLVCPYTCAHYPRSCAADRSSAGGCHGCCSDETESTPGQQKPGQPPSGSEEPCSCACVCKGALCATNGWQRGDDRDVATPLAFEWVLVVSPPWLPEDLLTYRPEPPPPKPLSGREIRTTIASLLL